METPKRTLTKEQARQIALAVVGIEPNLELHDPREYDHEVVIDQIEPTASGGQLGMKVYFSLTLKRQGSAEVVTKEYRLDIGYWETQSNFNPGLLGFFHKYIDNSEEVLAVEVLYNTGVVTELLRKYRVW